MSIRKSAFGLLVVLFCAAISFAAGSKTAPRVTPITSAPTQNIGERGSQFVSATACTAGSVDQVFYYMSGWVTGNELYKSYIDPARQCPNPYPYTVTGVNMPMYFTAATSFTASVDIEAIDNSNPACRLPGTMLALSSDWQINIPSAGGFNLWVPLDTPIVVDGPFFAGYFLGPDVDVAAGPAVYTDSTPLHCESYNAWDTLIGYVDLTNIPASVVPNFQFPGRLAMEVSGIASGTVAIACCTLTPAGTLSFGTVPIGTTKDLSFTISNCATTAQNGTISETCADFLLPSGGGSFSLGAGQNRVVTVRFSPTSATPYSCTVNTGLAGCPTITCTGTGQVTNCCMITPGVSVGYGVVPIGQSSDQNITIANCGSTSFSGMVALTCSDFSVISGGGVFTLAPLATRVVIVRFTPTTTDLSTCSMNASVIGCPAVTLTGQGSGQANPAPQISFMNPITGDTINGEVDLWAWESSGSKIVDYVSFAYSTGGPFVEITRDFDGVRPLRDGVSGAAAGNGYTWTWDATGLAEGSYTIRATAHDTLGRTATFSSLVVVRPKPPIPRITSPLNGSDFCTPLAVLMQNASPKLANIQVYRANALATYLQGAPVISEHSYGDVNGNPADGNFAVNGEFGDYYSGPTAATAAVKIWYDRGYTQVMKDGMVTLTLTDVAEQLATLFKTRTHKGTYDEDLFTGLKSYCATKGANLVVSYGRYPDYFALRTWVEDEQRSVILGLGGTPGLWVTVNGFKGWTNLDGSWTVSILNPLAGTLQDAPMRASFGSSELYVGGVWHRVDMMVSLLARDWAVSRIWIGADFNPSDGWSMNWTPSGLTEGTQQFVRAVGQDSLNTRGSSAILVRYTCATTYKKGDYNNDGAADIADLYVLIDAITRGGTPPVGGMARADANGDSSVNIADIVYYMNYLFVDPRNQPTR